jgi:parvulin-like peptidyl-prolyl isomerase
VHRTGFQLRLSLAWFAVVAVLAGNACRGVPDDAVAAYDGGYVTAAEARRFLTWFDARRLRTKAEVDVREAVTEVLSELAFRKILAEEVADDGPSPQAPLYLDQRASLLVDYYVERTGKRSHEVADEEALAFYNDHLADRFTASESVKFQHVFLRADRHSPEELAALERSIVDQVSAGVHFADLVAAHSESDSSTRDGVVGPVFRGRMDTAFEAQLYRLPVGRPGVVRTPQGDHVVVVLEKRPADVETFEAVKQQIVNAIIDRRNQTEKEQLLASLRARYGVEDRSADPGLRPDETVIRVRDRTMTQQQLDSYLTFWMSQPNRVGTGANDVRERAADELITANLLYLDAVDSGLDQEPEFLDRWAIRDLQRRSSAGAQRRLQVWAAEVGEDEVLQYFQENQARFAVPQRFQTSYLYRPLGGAPPFELQQRLEALAALAAAPGADPAEIERRCASTGARFVDMGWANPRQAARIGPEFQRRLLAMTAPGSTGAFKDEAGLYVILVRDIEARRAMSPPGDTELIRARYVELRRGDILGEMRQRVLEERHFDVLSTDVFSPEEGG